MATSREKYLQDEVKLQQGVKVGNNRAETHYLYIYIYIYIFC